jgi:hypothetical protein
LENKESLMEFEGKERRCERLISESAIINLWILRFN